MATKIITALVDGVIQQIEVEVTTSEEQITIEDRLVELEDKHPIVSDGNILVGNGTDELKEMTPEEVLSHINGASIEPMTSDQYEALESTNVNTLYVLTDAVDNSTAIYVQNDEPVDAPEGSLWIDLDGDSGAAIVNNELTIGDKSTGTNYTLYVDNGKLTMSESEA